MTRANTKAGPRMNWGRNVVFGSNRVAYPATEAEIQKTVVDAANDGEIIRVIGSGHSFTRLCQTNDLLLSLDNYQGVVSVDQERMQVTVKGGTKLNYLGKLLYEHGFAMINMGDIDAQSIAGTISTGTHGTGKAFGTISTQVTALKFINGKGEIVSCSKDENRDLFKSLQVSLGVFGVITEVTLQCVPAYKLLLENKKEDLNDVLSTIEQRNEENRNFEFYWMPYTETAWTKSSNVVKDGETHKDNAWNRLSELVLENYTFSALCEIARKFPSANKWVSEVVAQSIPTLNKINYSHQVYATTRLVRFTEMEYNIPAACYDEVMNAVINKVNSGEFAVHFPIESRWVKQDDILMSPANGRDSAYIACHVYYKKDNSTYFREMEAIFRDFGGRPHWGKMNTLTAEDLPGLYPDFPLFTQLRSEQDPDGVFLNDYLEELLV